MISRLQFSRLKHGDVLLWGRWPACIFRTVVEGPVDIAKSRNGNPLDHMHVIFAIRKRSWTNRAKTSYGWNDIKRIVRLVKRGRRSATAISREEYDRLKRLRFNPEKEYRREIRESLWHRKKRKWICPFKPLPLQATISA